MEVDLYILWIMSTHKLWLQLQSELMAAMNTWSNLNEAEYRID